jgi:phage baseplate assembly protein W
MAYNTPTSYNSSTGDRVRVISPASTVSDPNSNYVTKRIYRGFSTNNPLAHKGVLYDADIIKQDIYNHFMTAKGERVMMPEFGSIIWDYLYEPLDETTKQIIEQDAKDIINQDPRVSLQSLSVVEFERGIIVNATLMILPQNKLEEMAITFNVNQNSNSNSEGGY